MTLLQSAVIGVLFGAGSYLLLKPDLFRVIAGVILVANAANVTIMSAGRIRGEAPISAPQSSASDPLVQAMTITAIVIGFAVAVLLLGIVYRVHRSHDTVDLDELSRRSARDSETDEDDREEGSR